MGIDPCDDGTQTVLAEVPFSEMTDYVISLRAATQGRGKFDFDFGDRCHFGACHLVCDPLQEKREEVHRLPGCLLLRSFKGLQRLL